MDPPEHHRSLWAALQPEDFAWRIEPGSDEERARRVERAGKTVSVGRVAEHAGGGEVFVGSLAARRMRSDGGGVLDWVQQPLASGGVVVRHMHQTEVQRLFRTQDVFGGSDGCLSWHIVHGAVEPWRQLCAAVAGFFAVPFPRVPVDITDVISTAHLSAFRGGMGMAAHDFAVVSGQRSCRNRVPRCRQGAQARSGSATGGWHGLRRGQVACDVPGRLLGVG